MVFQPQLLVPGEQLLSIGQLQDAGYVILMVELLGLLRPYLPDAGQLLYAFLLE